jgi:YidC/Oxa1 family membrane protein insertase
VNFRRFAVILTCVSAGMLLLALYVQHRGGTQPQATTQGSGAATAPSAAAVATTAPAAPASPAAPATPAEKPAASPAAPAAATTPAPAAGGQVTWQTKVEDTTRLYAIGSLDKKTGYKFQVQLTNDGASIYDIQLSEYYATIEDKRLAEKLNDEQAYLREMAKDPAKYHGHYTVQSPLVKGSQTAEDLEKQLKQGSNVPVGDKLFLPLATQKIICTTASGMIWWRLDDASWMPTPAKKDKDSQSIGFEWIALRSGKEFLKVTKTYTVYLKSPKDSSEYSIGVKIDVENLSGEPMTVSLEQAGPTNLSREDVRSDERKLILGRGQQGKVTPVIRGLADGSAGPKGVKDIVQNVNDDAQLRSIEKTLLFGNFEQKRDLLKYLPDGLPEPVLNSSGQPVYKADASWWRSIFSPSSVQTWAQFYPALGRSDTVNPVLWTSMTNKFFTSLLYLLPAQGAGLQAAQYRTFEVGDSKTYRTEVNLEQIKIAPGKTGQVGFDFFAGPKDSDLFTAVPLYKQLNYDGTIETGSCCGITWFNWLTPVVMWLLEHLGKWVGNYGVAIIILVIIVRVLLHPLTKKGQVSMMKMQKLAPKMAALKEKYKDDKDALQRETMKFYKEQGATPILGCLPMMLQMPIWIALYTGLNADVALRQTAFLPVWITDLAGQDAVYHLPWAVNLPLLGTFMGPIVNINLLPILLTIAMYYQTKLTPTSMGPSTSPQQASQQKMMKYMSPVMMLVFFYNAPAGLNLYIMTSTFSSVFEQIIIRRHIQQKEAAESAAETQVVAPGKAARGSRPKKPKGPFWTKRG